MHPMSPRRGLLYGEPPAQAPQAQMNSGGTQAEVGATNHQVCEACWVSFAELLAECACLGVKPKGVIAWKSSSLQIFGAVRAQRLQLVITH